jgi:hypothetical protein
LTWASLNLRLKKWNKHPRITTTIAAIIASIMITWSISAVTVLMKVL